MCVNWNEIQYLASLRVRALRLVATGVASRLPGVRLPLVIYYCAKTIMKFISQRMINVVQKDGLPWLTAAEYLLLELPMTASRAYVGILST